jgi:hypothetical protein
MSREDIDRPAIRWATSQPESGFFRMPVHEPCELDVTGEHVLGTVWNLSALGAYIALTTPPPEIGCTVRVSFPFGLDRDLIICDAQVIWLNPPSMLAEGIGSHAGGLPPGCGLRFVTLGERERSAIERAVANSPTYRPI